MNENEQQEELEVKNEVVIPLEIRKSMMEFHDVYLAHKKLNDRLEELKKEIKEYMNNTNLKDHAQYGRKFQLQKQDKSKFDEEKTVELLDKLGRGDCIVLKKVADEKLITEAIKDGRLDMKDLAPAIKPNIILVLKYSEASKPGGEM